MKNLLSYLCILAIVLLAACRKEELNTYNDDVSKNSIYFPEARLAASQLLVSFGYADPMVKDSVIKIPVITIGSASTQDRPYNLSIDPTSTMKAGVDYEILNNPVVIKAGKVGDTLMIKLLRTASLKNEPLQLGIELKPNDYFTNNYRTYTITNNNVIDTGYHTKMTIRADDMAGAPPFWRFSQGNFGTFSFLKLQLLLSYYNLNINEMLAPNWYFADKNNIRVRSWANGLKAHLLRMKAAGNTIYEADGVTPMTMGPGAE